MTLSFRLELEYLPMTHKLGLPLLKYPSDLQTIQQKELKKHFLVILFFRAKTQRIIKYFPSLDSQRYHTRKYHNSIRNSSQRSDHAIRLSYQDSRSNNKLWRELKLNDPPTKYRYNFQNYFNLSVVILQLFVKKKKYLWRSGVPEFYAKISKFTEKGKKFSPDDRIQRTDFDIIDWTLIHSWGLWTKQLNLSLLFASA